MVQFESLGAMCPNLQVIEFINMPGLTVAGVENLCQSVPGLIEFNMHYCPRVNIRLILPLLKLSGIKTICLNQFSLACQHNAYSGLIGAHEWKDLGVCNSLKRLLINSSNLTMDVLNFLLPKVPFLERLVVHPRVYGSLDDKIVVEDPDVGLVGSTELTIASVDNKHQRDVKRPFKITGLLKDEFDTQFSPSMLQHIQQVVDYEVGKQLADTAEVGKQLADTAEESCAPELCNVNNKEALLLAELGDDPELLAEVIAEMKANGEWSE